MRPHYRNGQEEEGNAEDASWRHYGLTSSPYSLNQEGLYDLDDAPARTSLRWHQDPYAALFQDEALSSVTEGLDFETRTADDDEMDTSATSLSAAPNGDPLSHPANDDPLSPHDAVVDDGGRRRALQSRSFSHRLLSRFLDIEEGQNDLRAVDRQEYTRRNNENVIETFDDEFPSHFRGEKAEECDDSLNKSNRRRRRRQPQQQQGQPSRQNTSNDKLQFSINDKVIVAGGASENHKQWSASSDMTNSTVLCRDVLLDRIDSEISMEIDSHAGSGRSTLAVASHGSSHKNYSQRSRRRLLRPPPPPRIQQRGQENALDNQPGAILVDARPFGAPRLRSIDNELRAQLEQNVVIAGSQRRLANTSIVPHATTVHDDNVVYAESMSTLKSWCYDKSWKARLIKAVCLLIGVAMVAVGVFLIVWSRRRKQPNNAPTPLPPTSSPTSTPTVVLDEYIEMFLPLASRDVLTDPETHQHAAIFWLANVDQLPVDRTLPRLKQRYALLSIFFAMKSSQQGPRTALDHWLDPTKHECDWGPAINCDTIALDYRVLLSLDLSRSQLQGTIPSEIALLSELEILQLNENAITGTVTSFLGSLTRLHMLDVERNQLSGAIPSEIGLLTALTKIDVSHNFLNNTIPVETFQLRDLRTLDLSYNRLNGTLSADLQHLEVLTMLCLRNNDLTGTLPNIMSSLVELAFLNLDYNYFIGNIPNDHSFIVKRVEATISNNLLTGTIPTPSDDEVTQALLDLQKGAFRLRKVDISSNLLSGELPRFVEALPSLLFYEVGNNMLSGPVVMLPGSRAYHIGLANNLFNGTIPHRFGDALTRLDLGGNDISGSIPSELGALSSIAYLDISRNPGIVGSIPDTLASSTTLRYIAASGCSINGTIPSELGSLTRLESIALDGTDVVGTIPEQFSSLSSLRQLRLNATGLTGTIPADLGYLSKLEILLLNDLGLTGTIPSSFALLEKLDVLRLENNMLVGSVPDGFCRPDGGEREDLATVDCNIGCSCCRRVEECR